MRTRLQPAALTIGRQLAGRGLSTAPAPVTEQAIRAKLLAEFPAAEVSVEDTSGGCGAFFVLHVAHPAFHGLSTLKQHQLVTRSLANEIARIHGLRIHTRPPAPPPASAP